MTTPFLSVIIASKGRPDMLQGTVDCLMRQTLMPQEIIVAVTGDEDYLPALLSTPRLRLVTSPAGSAIQRNRAISELHPDSTITAFLDDDVELEDGYLAKICAFMEEHPDVAGFSGDPVLDKPRWGGMEREEARQIIQDTVLEIRPPREWRELFGCNMTVRSAAVRQEPFDERMVLYAYLEDRDYAARIAQYGRIMSYTPAKLIHFGSRGGRVSEKMMGYAMTMNSTYLFRKGVLNLKEYARLGPGTFAANLLGTFGLRSLGQADILGRETRLLRLQGNVLALRDIILYGIRPEQIVLLKQDRSRPQSEAK